MQEAPVPSLDLIPFPRLEIPDIHLIQMLQLAIPPHSQLTPTLLLLVLLFLRALMAAEMLDIFASRVALTQTSPDNLTTWVLMATKNIPLNMTE
jgi:hypothetical protein